MTQLNLDYPTNCFRDHPSLITIEQKHRKKALQRDAYPNHMLNAKLQEWIDKGFTAS